MDLVHFELSGGGDMFEFNGKVEIIPVPEVNGGVFFGIAGLAFVAIMRIRRR